MGNVLLGESIRDHRQHQCDREREMHQRGGMGMAQMDFLQGENQLKTITALSGNKVTLDIPLSDSLDAQYVAPGATMQKYTFDGRFSQVGVETLRVTAPVRGAPASTTLATSRT